MGRCEGEVEVGVEMCVVGANQGGERLEEEEEEGVEAREGECWG